jgi:hypothetical protein
MSRHSKNENPLPRSIPQVVRELCLAFPAVEETVSHDRPDYRIADKSFARLMVNHHGDGRVGLWLHMPPGAQALYTDLEPEAFFVPPYVGNRGWLGVELNKGLSWVEICARVREAWEHTAPAGLAGELKSTPSIAPPDVEMKPEDINPLLATRVQTVLTEFRKRCERLPEVIEDSQFGRPVWKAGKKTFAGVFSKGGRLHFDFWVGVEHQVMMTGDPRFTIPKFTGHNGWMNLDVEDYLDWTEVEGLLETSYRHFALKRMLRELDAQ